MKYNTFSTNNKAISGANFYACSNAFKASSNYSKPCNAILLL